MILVYYTKENTPYSESFIDSEFTKALNFVNSMRGLASVTHVIISSEFSDSVGKPGVDSVQNGKTPDGFEYDWTKRR